MKYMRGYVNGKNGEKKMFFSVFKDTVYTSSTQNALSDNLSVSPSLITIEHAGTIISSIMGYETFGQTMGLNRYQANPEDGWTIKEKALKEGFDYLVLTTNRICLFNPGVLNLQKKDGRFKGHIDLLPKEMKKGCDVPFYPIDLKAAGGTRIKGKSGFNSLLKIRLLEMVNINHPILRTPY